MCSLHAPFIPYPFFSVVCFKINLSYAIFSQPFSTRLSCLKHSTNLCFVNLFMSLPFFFNPSQLNYPFNNFYFINLSSVNFCMLMPLFTQLPFLQWLFYQPFLWQPLSYLYSMSVSINHSQLNYPFWNFNLINLSSVNYCHTQIIIVPQPLLTQQYFPSFLRPLFMFLNIF